MKIYQFDNYEKLDEFCANQIKNLIIKKPNCILGLATGSSPIGMYKKLAEYNSRNLISFKNVTTINLDEYVGLSPENEQSYRFFMNTNLFNNIDIDKKNTFVPNGLAKNLKRECINYDNLIKKVGKIDLQILGIGNNGHIGFNEPSSSFIPNTHVVKLSQNTIQANSRFFSSPDKVPKKAITMGIKSIMSSKKILLIVNTPQKLEITKKALTKLITPKIPASILQLHKNLIVAMIKD